MAEPAVDAQRRADVRALYEAGGAKLADLAGMLGLTVSAFYRLRLREGWAAPKKRKARKRPSKAKAAQRVKRAPPPAEPVPFDPHVVTDKIEAAVEQGLALAADDLGRATTADAERNARMLASLSKALGELRKLKTPTNARNRKGPDGHVERPARDMATLRADIARRLEEALRSRPDSGSADDV